MGLLLSAEKILRQQLALRHPTNLCSAFLSAMTLGASQGFAGEQCLKQG